MGGTGSLGGTGDTGDTEGNHGAGWTRVGGRGGRPVEWAALTAVAGAQSGLAAGQAGQRPRETNDYAVETSIGRGQQGRARGMAAAGQWLEARAWT